MNKSILSIIALVGAVFLLPGCGAHDQNYVQKRAVQKAVKKEKVAAKVIKSAQKTINYTKKEYKRELTWVAGGYSKEGIRKELEHYVPGKPTTGFWYKFADAMLGAEAHTTPYVSYKVKLDRAVNALKHDYKKLINRDIQDSIFDEVKELITNLELMSECVAGLKDYREEMRYIADRNRVHRIVTLNKYGTTRSTVYSY